MLMLGGSDMHGVATVSNSEKKGWNNQRTY